jgi:hypothetical protein
MKILKNIGKVIGYGIVIMYTVIGILLYIGVSGAP